MERVHMTPEQVTDAAAAGKRLQELLDARAENARLTAMVAALRKAIVAIAPEDVGTTARIREAWRDVACVALADTAQAALSHDRAVRLAALEEAARVAEKEAEIPGEMPDAVRQEASRMSLEGVIRSSASATSKAIVNGIRALAADPACPEER